jgi:hypothetical protein
MIIKFKEDFIDQIKTFDIKSEYAVVKPNWVSSQIGEYTEPEILDWLLEALPRQKKIILESYTPWRGLKLVEGYDHKGQDLTLEGGKKDWDFYRKQDEYFLQKSGNGAVLQKHKAEYLNITDEVWYGNSVESETIKKLVVAKEKSVKWQELYSYIPKKLFDIRKSATLISLSKIKTEEGIPIIYISMSTKNLFGLIPHPSRWIPFHGKDHSSVPEVIKDIYTIYTSIFDKTLWITEGIKTLVRNYCQPTQKIIKNQNLLFIGKDALKVDSEACVELGIDPKKVPHLQI